MKTKKIITLALLTAVSLILFVVEAQIPPITPLFPGIKIGLANIVTLFILYRKNGKIGEIVSYQFTVSDVVLVVNARILLSAFIIGISVSLFFSFFGGIAALMTMLLLRKFLPPPITSVAGALVHNLTQIGIAILIYDGMGILMYLPALILSGIGAGLLTGFAVVILLRRLR